MMSLRSSMERVKKSVFGIQSAVALLAGGAGFGALASSALRTVDSLAKVSQKLGITTQALAGFRYAGELSGVSVQTMDMALQRFTRRAAEAAVGTGEAKGALEELRIDAQKLVKLPLDTQMMVIADAFEGVESQADRVRLAMKLFDSEGVALVNTMDGGANALRRAMIEAESLGLTIDKTRAQGIEKFNDSMTRLRSAVQGAFIQAMGDAAPELQKITAALQEKLVPAVTGLIKGFRWFLENLDTITALMKGFLAAFVIGKVIDMITVISALVRNIIVLGKVSKISGRALTRGLLGPVLGVGIVVADVTGMLDKFLKQFGLIETDLPGVTEAINDSFDATKNLGVELGLIIPVSAEAQNSLKNLEKTTKSLSDSMESIVTRGVNSMTDGLTDLIMGTKSASEAFRDMASSIIRDLTRMAIQKMITDQIFGAIMSFMSPGSISTASGYTSIGPAAGTSGGSAGTHFADGGLMKAGRAAIVGERGPELIIPNRNSTVVPNDQLGGGGGTVNVTLNISTGVAQTVRAEISNLLPQITNATKAAVVDAKRRGGSFAGAFGG